MGRPSADARVRPATPEDADAVGALLHAFNREFDDPAPPPSWLADRFRALLGGGDTAALLAGPGPDGVAVLRFRPAIWTDALECYLAELYVAPAHRGRGLGRALLEAAIALARQRGADRMDLGTSETDTAARALYESVGFVRREHPPDGPIMFVYEREL